MRKGERKSMKFLTLQECSTKTGLPVTALRNLIFKKKFPYLKLAGKIRTSEDELNRWLELSTRVTAEEARQAMH